MAKSDRSSVATGVFVISMALLVTGMGLDGRAGILLTLFAIAGCLVSLALRLGGKDAGSDAGSR